MTASLAQRTHSDYAELLASIFDFMRKSGIRDDEVQEISGRALTHAITRGEPSRREQKADIAIAALVLDTWHRNRRYLNQDGSPRAIRLLGRAPSVEALIRMECIGRNSASLARQLKALGLLMSRGRSLYEPAARVALVASLDPLIQQYVARSSTTLLKTIRNNVRTSKNGPRLIERFAEVPDLPARCAAEFREFSQAQGWAFLKTLNDWLESRRVRRVRKAKARTIRAGVHLYAYLDAPRRASSKRP